jgi:hypothetical protein
MVKTGASTASCILIQIRTHLRFAKQVIIVEPQEFHNHKQFSVFLYNGWVVIELQHSLPGADILASVPVSP